MTVTPCPPPTRKEYLTAALVGHPLAAVSAITHTAELHLDDIYDAYVALGCSPRAARQRAWTDVICEAVL
jgi:hypothetical protein